MISLFAHDPYSRIEESSSSSPSVRYHARVLMYGPHRSLSTPSVKSGRRNDLASLVSKHTDVIIKPLGTDENSVLVFVNQSRSFSFSPPFFKCALNLGLELRTCLALWRLFNCFSLAECWGFWGGSRCCFAKMRDWSETPIGRDFALYGWCGGVARII